MTDAVEELERRIAGLRTALRKATLAGEREQARALRADLRVAERAWDEALATESETEAEAESELGAKGHAGSTATRRTGALLPLREQVHEALSLLTVPAAPRLIAVVHEAFFATAFLTTRVTSIRRDEERSFRLAPYARPYYICATLTADRLAPSRGLLAVSTWPLARRMIGSLSPRVDFLVGAIHVARAVERLPAESASANRLLRRFAANIPGVPVHSATTDVHTVIQAAQAELEVHEATDSRVRDEAARRARDQLDDVQQLFGTRFGEQRRSG